MRELPSDLARGLPILIDEAFRSGLLESVRARSATAREHAVALSLSPRAVELVLDVLAAMGLLRKAPDGRYGSDASASFPWDHLAEFLQTGRPLPMLDSGEEMRGATYARVVENLSDRFSTAAGALARHLRPARRILDAGAGSGIWSLTMAQRSGAEVVIGLDLPLVVGRFVERADAMGLSDCVQTIAGSYFDVGPEAPVDRVVLANVLHLETEAAAALLVKRAASWLTQEGEIVIIDCFGGESFDSNLCRTLYALHLGLRTEHGGVRAASAIQRLCEEAGLCHTTLLMLDPLHPGLGALVARNVDPGGNDGE